jgi:hypothetical protein
MPNGPNPPRQNMIDATVTSTELEVNVRAITVHIRGVHKESQELERLLAQVDKIVRMFLEKHWIAPRRVVTIQPLSYVLLPGPDDPDFAKAAEEVRGELQTRLFGDKDVDTIDVKALVGPRDEIEKLAKQDEGEFLEVLDDPDMVGGASATRKFRSTETTTGAKLPRRTIEWRGRICLYAGYNVEKSAIVSYTAMLASGDDTSVAVRHEDLVASIKEDIAEFELAALNYAAQKVVQQAYKGAVGYCHVPLSIATLRDRRRRDAYLTEAARHDPEVLRFVVPSIFGGSLRPASTFLVDVVGRLKNHFGLTDWRTPSCSIVLDPFEHAGMFSVTLVRPPQWREFDFELERLPALTHRAKGMKLNIGVTGVRDRSELDAAIQGGAQFVAGPAVSGMMPSLAPRTKVAMDALPINGRVAPQKPVRRAAS